MEVEETCVGQPQRLTEASEVPGTFRHTPLQAGQIRLLVISPGSKDDPIDVHLQIKSFSSSHPPRYAALSYVWGSPDSPVPITLDQKLHYITANLAAAIRRIRHAHEDLVYWIDALCVDQNNISERNTQVRLMRHIYECAMSVTIYLGEMSEDTDTAIRVIRNLAEIAYYNSDARNCSYSFALFKIATLQAEVPKPDSPDWLAFSNFFARDWFGRVWVIQEAVVGKPDPVVFVGMKVLQWSMIGVAVNWFHGEHGYKGRVIEEDRDDWSYHAHLTHRCRWVLQDKSSDMSFLATLAAARTCHATDERDKVFALVGLSNKLWKRPEGEEFQIDYGKETAEVFRDVARYLIEDTMSLDVLSNIEDHCGRKRSGLPSWAPDWAKTMSCTPFALDIHFSGYKACGDSKVVVLEEADPDVLALFGICVDEITETAAPLAALGREEVDGPPQTYTVLRSQWDEIASKLEPYPTGGSALDAFWRTLIADVGEVRRPAGDEYFFHFARFIKISEGGPSGIDAAVKECLATRNFGAGDEIMDESNDPATEKSNDGSAVLFFNAVRYAAFGRRFFATKKGLMGIGPPETRKGDKVYILSGGNVPVILRESTNTASKSVLRSEKSLILEVVDQESCEQTTVPNCASLVGEAYVHGIMHGESIAPGGEGIWQRIRLA